MSLEPAFVVSDLFCPFKRQQSRLRFFPSSECPRPCIHYDADLKVVALESVEADFSASCEPQCRPKPSGLLEFSRGAALHGRILAGCLDRMNGARTFPRPSAVRGNLAAWPKNSAPWRPCRRR